MRRSLLALATLALLVPGCRHADKPAPGLSSDAPADASDPAPVADPSGSADPEPPPPSGPSLVDLHGTAHLPPPLAEGAPRLASIAMLTEVRAHPDANATKVGYLRAGAVVEIEPGEHGKAGCPGGCRKIKPYGYVCLGPEATLDLENPIARAATRRPDVTQKLPYMYGIATRGGPVYARIPTEEQLKEYEPHLAKHLAKWAKDKESGATYGLDVWMKWKTKEAPPRARSAGAEGHRRRHPLVPQGREGGAQPLGQGEGRRRGRRSTTSSTTTAWPSWRASSTRGAATTSRPTCACSRPTASGPSAAPTSMAG